MWRVRTPATEKSNRCTIWRVKTPGHENVIAIAGEKAWP